MKTSNQIMEKAGVKPRLRLATKTDKGIVSTGIQHVKLVSDRIVMAKDPNGREREYMEYTVEHNGKIKVYLTKLKDEEGKLAYLVKNLAEFEEGDRVTFHMKKLGIKNYVEVVADTKPQAEDLEETEEDVDPLDEANPEDIPF